MAKPSLGERLRNEGRRIAVLLGFLLLFALLLLVFRGVMVPFLVAIFLAYMIEPLVSRMARLEIGPVRLGRGGALLALYLALGGLLALAAIVLLPRATKQLETLASRAPAAFQTVRHDWLPKVDAWLERVTGPEAEGEEEDGEEAEPDDADSAAPDDEPGRGVADAEPDAAAGPEAAVETEPFDLTKRDWVLHVDGRVDPKTGRLRGRVSPSPFGPTREQGSPASLSAALDMLLEEAQTHFFDAVTLATGVLRGVVGFVYTSVLVLMITAFLVADRARIVAFFHGLAPEKYQPHYQRAVKVVDRGLSGVIRGQILVCLVNGFLTWIGLVILGVPYSLLLGAVAAVFSLIPIFGTILSSVPIVAIALLEGFGYGLAALGWIVVIHLLEANVINPRIIGTTAKLHPLIIIFALLAGEHGFGVIGALLAVPAASILISMFRYARAETKEDEEAAAPV